MRNRQDIAAIKASLRLSEVVESLTGVRLEGSGGRWRARCPFHVENTPSFFVDDSTGRYHCFGAACGKSGDVIQFIADWQNLDFREALCFAAELARFPGNTPPAATRSAWSQWVRSRVPRTEADGLLEIPSHVTLPRPGNIVTIHDPLKDRSFRVTPAYVHVYRNSGGKPLCLVLRALTADGGKFFVQTKWNGGEWQLARLSRSTKRPVYGIEDLPEWSHRNSRQILIVEGETTRDAAADLLSAHHFLILTAMGGANAVKYADWEPLAASLRGSNGSFKITIWPDADTPIRGPNPIDRQQAFADAVKASILGSGLSPKLEFRRVLPPASVAPGWDIADAREQGWNGARLLTHIAESSVGMSDPKPEPSPEPGF
ncbi:MAG: CHC2 zinc finger domain-containing protein [Rhodobacteraceae bacterium]|nr:CHC2 zinc finger domain-containing protein [Paracoccaceae bacterium]